MKPPPEQPHRPQMAEEPRPLPAPARRTARAVQSDSDPDAIALQRLLQAIFEQCGLDFRDYAYSSIKRRVMRCVAEERCGTIANLQARALADTNVMERMLRTLTVPVTAMFRDPGFFLALREHAIPILRTYPFLRFWVAGCATGEEVYSLAILLHEEGLTERCRIYATDLSETALDQAKTGIFPLSAMQDYTRNYQDAGGRHAFSEYYTADNQFAAFRPYLRENVVFAAHNLAGDASFNEFNMIFCRNVMIYFNRSLQDRVHRLLYESLVMFGYLGLGRSESVRFSACERSYEAVAAKERLYRKIQ
jgi:chemotaxis protein methyltransferase CheR